MIKPRIPSSKDIPYLQNNRHEKVKEFQKTKSAMKSSKMIAHAMYIHLWH
jgi:hypothetical protein